MVSAAPAFAANQEVQLADDVFMPSAVAVKPGESVTWNNPGLAGGTADPHNVSFDDGTFTSPGSPIFGPWTAIRTFPDAGAFRFYCQEPVSYTHLTLPTNREV